MTSVNFLTRFVQDVGLFCALLIMTQGHCKFGPKCADLHVFSDGQRVNPPGGGPVDIRVVHSDIDMMVNPDPHHGQSSGLANSLYHAKMAPQSPLGILPSFRSLPPLRRRTRMGRGRCRGDSGYESLDAVSASSCDPERALRDECSIEDSVCHKRPKRQILHPTPSPPTRSVSGYSTTLGCFYFH
jgi:hypothetical protein